MSISRAAERRSAPPLARTILECFSSGTSGWRVKCPWAVSLAVSRAGDFFTEADSKFQIDPPAALIGRLKERIWTVFFTERIHRIRIISARRARANEEILYDESRTT
jgi:hypothetical protein